MKKIKEFLEKISKWKYLILVVLTLAGIFYWFELRPLFIKRQCSWFTQIEAGKPAVPAYPGITKEEAEKEFNKIKERNDQLCLNSMDEICKALKMFNYPIAEVPPRPAIPAEPDKEVTREATKNQYDTCLRHHGLK